MKKDSENIAVDLAVVMEEALRFVAESTEGVMPPALEKALVENHGLKRRRRKRLSGSWFPTAS